MLTQELSRNEFILARKKGLTYQEIGTIYGVSKQAVHFYFSHYTVTRTLKSYQCVKCGKNFSHRDQLNIDNRRPICDNCKISKDTKKYWCPKYVLLACRECGTNKVKHQSNGLCERCQNRHRYATNLVYKEGHKRAVRNYRKICLNTE